MINIPKWSDFSLGKKEDPPWYKDINDMAENFWSQDKELPFVGVYISPFGEHQVIPIRKQDIDKAIKLLQKMKDK